MPREVLLDRQGRIVAIKMGGGSSTKFGMSIDNFIGNIDSNGVLGSSTIINGITFTGVTEIGQRALMGKFKDVTITGLISFPDLTTIDSTGLSESFYGTNITSVNFPSLTTIGYYGLSDAFATCYNMTGTLDLSFVTNVADGGLLNAFSSTNITSIDLSGVTILNPSSISGMCEYCTSLINADLSGITSTTEGTGFGYCFDGCSSLTSVNLSNLTNLCSDGLGYTFLDCSSLTTIDLSSLTTLSGWASMQHAFENCSSLTSINLSSLETIADGSNYTFDNAFANTSLVLLSFPSLKEQNWWNNVNLNEYCLFTEMLSGVDDCVVHFPSNLQSYFEDLDDFIDGFGGNNTIILFDLPSTATENNQSNGGGASEAEPDTTDPIPVIENPDDDDVNWE